MNTSLTKKIKINGIYLTRARDNLIDTVSKKNEQRDQINKLVDDIQDLTKKADLDLQMPEKLPHHKVYSELDELINAASVIPEEHRKKLKKDIFDSVPSVPAFDKFDLFTIIGLSGLVLLADWLLIGLPPKTKWLDGNTVIAKMTIVAHGKSRTLFGKTADRHDIHFEAEVSNGTFQGVARDGDGRVLVQYRGTKLADLP